MQRIVFVLLLGALGLAACAGHEVSPAADGSSTPAAVPGDYAGLTNPLGPDAAEAGADLFQSNCQMCHGPQGHGDGPAGQSLDPRPRNLAELQAAVEDDFLFWRIHDGVPGTSMVAWKGILTNDQIWQIVSFIRTLK